MAKVGEKGLVAPESGLSLLNVRKSQGVSGIGCEAIVFVLNASSLMLEKLNQALFTSDCGSAIVGMVGNAGEGCPELELGDEKLNESKSARFENTSLVSKTKGDISSGLSSNISVGRRRRDKERGTAAEPTKPLRKLIT
jgi:hypothetical protein